MTFTPPTEAELDYALSRRIIIGSKLPPYGLKPFPDPRLDLFNELAARTTSATELSVLHFKIFGAP